MHCNMLMEGKFAAEGNTLCSYFYFNVQIYEKHQPWFSITFGYGQRCNTEAVAYHVISCIFILNCCGCGRISPPLWRRLFSACELRLIKYWYWPVKQREMWLAVHDYCHRTFRNTLQSISSGQQIFLLLSIPFNSMVIILSRTLTQVVINSIENLNSGYLKSLSPRDLFGILLPDISWR